MSQPSGSPKALSNIQRARSPSLQQNKPTASPHNHAMDPVSRKAVNGDNNNLNNNGATAAAITESYNSQFNGNSDNKYSFESPIGSVRNSYVGDPAMDPQVKLEEYEWKGLEEQFAKRMEGFRAVEEGIWEEWRGWGEIFGAWASTISVHDEERASKRLRTRIAYTQSSEEALEAKRQHYIKVVQAFESALTLLADAPPVPFG